MRVGIIEEAALNGVATRVANKEVKIKWTVQNQYYTDGQTIFLGSEVKRDLESAQGLTVHESGHIGYDSFTININQIARLWGSSSNLQLIREIFNVTEDPRIDEINHILFPGFYRNLQNYSKKNNLIAKFEAKIKETGNLLGYIFLTLKNISGYENRPSCVSEAEWKELLAAKKLLLTELSVGASIITAKIIYDIIKKNTPAPHENQKSDAENHGDNRNKRSESGKKTDEAEEMAKMIKELMDEMAEKNKKNRDGKADGEGEGEGGKGKGGEKGDKPTEEELENAEFTDEESDGEDGYKIPIPGGGEYDPNGEGETEELEISQILKDKLMKKLLKVSKKNIEEAKKKITNFAPIKHTRRARKVHETKIENEATWREKKSYKETMAEHSGVIRRLKHGLKQLKNTSGWDHSSKSGRVNSKLISGIMSDFQYTNFYSRKVVNQELRILIMVDASGSMGRGRMAVAKEALIIFSEAFNGIAKSRIVLFTGTNSALNVEITDWDEELTEEKANKIGCTQRYGSNLDGVSIAHEAAKLQETDYILVISDGQPSGSGYGLADAVADLRPVLHKHKVFAFSIDANGNYLEEMYGKSYCIVQSRIPDDLTEMLCTVSSRIIKEFQK